MVPSLAVPLRLAVLLLAGCASAGRPVDLPLLQQQVMETERAFARTMVERYAPAPVPDPTVPLTGEQ